MYSFKNLLTAAPEKVKNTVLAVLGVAAGIRGWDPTLLETVGVGIAIERLLDLFYVAPVQRAKDEREALVAFDNVAMHARSHPQHGGNPAA